MDPRSVKYFILSKNHTKRVFSMLSPNEIAAIYRPTSPVEGVKVYDSNLECVYSDDDSELELKIDKLKSIIEVLW